MSHKKSAFTLIELLVVIAIIAILAAILFPVFAQAKMAAKGAVTISNVKQLNLAFQMYAGDVDDMLPYRGTMNGNGASWGTGACTASGWGCPTWDKLIQPYVKSYGIFESPVDRTPAIPSNFGDVKRSFRVAKNVVRGVAGVPNWGGAEYPVRPISMTSIPASSKTILFTEQRNEAVTYATWWIWSTFWENWVWTTGSENTVGNQDTTWVVQTSPVKYYSGIDYSRGGNAAFGMLDGSVKNRARGYKFPGYEQRRSFDRAVDPTVNGVCLDYEDFAYGTPRECALPQD